jgi:hypothetical protein
MLDNNPRLYLDELQARLYRITLVRYSITTIRRAIQRPPSEGGIGYTNKVLEERAVQTSAEEQFLYKCCLASVPDPSMLVFLDESHKSRADGRRRRGWGHKGQNIISERLFESSGRHNYTLIGAVDINGFVENACCVVWSKHSDTDQNPTRGTVDQVRFLEYVEEDLLPELGSYDRCEPRSVVVMDNASVHKHPRVVPLIESAGARVVWTAPYSPWLNPIERCFSLYKKSLNRSEMVVNPLIKHLKGLQSVDRRTMINLYKGLSCIQHIDELEQRAKWENLKIRMKQTLAFVSFLIVVNIL